MATEGLVTMSQKEIVRIEILEKVKVGKITRRKGGVTPSTSTLYILAL